MNRANRLDVERMGSRGTTGSVAGEVPEGRRRGPGACTVDCTRARVVAGPVREFSGVRAREDDRRGSGRGVLSVPAVSVSHSRSLDLRVFREAQS